MAQWIWCAVVLVLSCASVIATDGIPGTEKIPVAPTSKPTNKTTPSLTPPTSTTTTTIPTKPTTPTTTTVPTKPTTSSTTTVIPTTTTAAPESTTHTPAKPAPPSANIWNYTDGTTNISCIVVQFAVQFNITYATANGTRTAVLNLPKDSAVTDGNCGNSTQWIQLSWPTNATTQQQNTFIVKFGLNSTTQQYHTSLISLNLVYNASIFPDAASNSSISLVNKKLAWYAGVSHSYRCMPAKNITLSPKEKTGGALFANVTVSDLQVQAFHSEKGTQFGIAVDCEGAADVPDVVPIVVGCALGSLVLVVLVAYLVGRRRSQARGYLSM